MSARHASETRRPIMPSKATRAWSVPPALRAATSSAANSSGCSTVRRCPCHSTFVRVTASTGLVGMCPSITAYFKNVATVQKRRAIVAGA